jgi:hypothetical protein
LAVLSRDEAVRIARAAVPEISAPEARAYLVERLDGGADYYLVVLSAGATARAAVRLEAGSGTLLGSARLSGGRSPVVVDAAAAIVHSGLSGATEATLVWRPCSASLSPLSPIWRVHGGGATVYVDQAGKRWANLPPAGRGG